MSAPVVRHFRPDDEAAVRRICYNTALRGAPLRGVFDDERLAVDAILGYHIWVESDAFFVSESVDGVMGYLAGCLDTVRYESLHVQRVLPRIVWRTLTHGHWAHRRSWRLIFDSLAYARLLRVHRQPFLNAYPAHLHINVAAAARGRSVGVALVSAFIATLEERHISGVHAVVQSPHGASFFVSNGFEVLTQYSCPPLLHLPPGQVTIVGRRMGPVPGKRARQAPRTFRPSHAEGTQLCLRESA